MIWWNGVPLPVPVSPITYTYRDIEGTNSGQTLGGSYSKKVIARKEDVLLTWQGLSEVEAKAVAAVKKNSYGNLTYYSPQAGKFITAMMYTEDLTAELTDAQLPSGRLLGEFNASVQFRQK